MRILQELIADMGEEKYDEIMKLIGNSMDHDFKAIFDTIIQTGATPYAAAKELVDSGLSSRSFRTLLRHAKDIERNLIDYLTGITPATLFLELREKEEVECPGELVTEFETLLRAERYRFEKVITYKPAK